MSITSLSRSAAIVRPQVFKAPVVNPTAESAVATYKSTGLAKAVVIQDTAANINAQWNDLKTLANAGKISAFKITDATKQTLTLTATDLANSTALMGKIAAVATLKVSDSSANIASNLDLLQAQAGKLGSIEQSGTKSALSITAAQLKSASAALAKIDAGAYTLSLTGVNASTLSAVQANAKVTSFSFTDTSVNIALKLDALQLVGNKLTSISQSGTKTALTITAAQLSSNSATLDKIDASADAPYTLSITGVQTSQLSDIATNTKITSFSVNDTAAHVSEALTALQTANTKIKTITLTDAAPALSVKVADFTSAAGVLAKITSKFTYKVSDSSANISAALDTLQAKVKSISSLALTDTERPTLSVTATQYKKDSAVIAKISGAALSVKFSGNYAEYGITAKTDGTFVVSDSKKRVDESNTFKGANFFEFKDFTAFGDTGDANLNALLSGGTNFWWSNGQGAKSSDTQIKAGVYGLDTSSAKHDFTYSFMGDTLPATATAQDQNGYAPMTDVQKAAVVDAFSYLSSLVNVTFTLSNSAAGDADINFGTNSQTSSAGYANPPNGSGDHKVFLMLDKDEVSNASFSYGSYGWQTLIHEIGHTMGLKHPGNYNAGGGGAAAPYLPKTTDNSRYSVMSYNRAADTGYVTRSGQSYSSNAPLSPKTYMLYDIAALQYIYGANTSGDDVVPYQTIEYGSDWQGIQSVWTPEGGTLNASAMGATQSNIIDFREGAFSSIGIVATDAAAYVASFTKSIQSFIKTNQTYFGFNNTALAYGSYLDGAVGGAATDAFFVDSNNIEETQTIDGGSGSDIVYLNGSINDWTLSSWDGSGDTSGTATNTVTNKTVNLANIEKIKYYDSKVYATTHSAIDLKA